MEGTTTYHLSILPQQWLLFCFHRPTWPQWIWVVSQKVLLHFQSCYLCYHHWWPVFILRSQCEIHCGEWECQAPKFRCISILWCNILHVKIYIYPNIKIENEIPIQWTKICIHNYLGPNLLKILNFNVICQKKTEGL